MNPLASSRWQIAVGACACAASGTYLFAVNPAQGGYPTCLLYQTTGLYCAGCGATRACHALLHGRLLEALHDNMLFVTALPIMLYFLLPPVVTAWRDEQWSPLQMAQGALVRRAFGLAAVALIFATLRNIPGATFEWLRPLA